MILYIVWINYCITKLTFDCSGNSFFFFFRLIRYLHPTDKELRQLLGLKKKDSKTSKRPLNGQNDNIDVFQIPKNLEIEVTIPISICL